MGREPWTALSLRQTPGSQRVTRFVHPLLVGKRGYLPSLVACPTCFTGPRPREDQRDSGAIALAHPVGATGAILAIKLMRALERIDGAASSPCASEAAREWRPSSSGPDPIRQQNITLRGVTTQ